jgi:hypothetical protein
MWNYHSLENMKMMPNIINDYKGLQFYLGWCLQPEARYLMKRISVDVPDTDPDPDPTF